MAGTEVQKHSVHTLVFRSLKRTHDMFIADQGNLPGNDLTSDEPVLSVKARDEYGLVQQHADSSTYKDAYYTNTANQTHSSERTEKSGFISEDMRPEPAKKSALVKVDDPATQHSAKSNKTLVAIGNQQMLVPKKGLTVPKPKWHPPWKLYRVISGHIGWVRCVAVEPGNEWFVTGAADRVIKIWDLASGTLKLSLTGHVSTVRGVVVSARQPYLFSCGEDKQVKCWDLEQNKVVRHYHGHLSAVHAMDLHPSIDLLVTCGRDATARVWDIRTASCIHTLTGHTSTVADVKCQATDPQVITGSHDNTVRLWDLVAGKSAVTLTHHKKSIRSVLIHPTGNMMASASADNIREWKFPDGDFIQSLSGHNAIINTIAMNEDNVLVSGADNGSLYFWDFKSGYNFQREQTKVQPGSIDSEAGIFASTFDRSGTRFITCEADKTIKIYKEDDTATEDTHPINWRPDIMRKKRY